MRPPSRQGIDRDAEEGGVPVQQLDSVSTQPPFGSETECEGE